MTYYKQKAIKYFIQQKVIEILIGLVIIAAIIFIPYLIGSFLPDTWNISYTTELTEPYNFEFWEYWFTGILSILCGILIVLLIWMVIYGPYLLIKYWIETNWDKAKYRAMTE